MNIKFQNSNPASWTAETAIALCFENEKPLESAPEIAQACPWLAAAPGLNHFKGEKKSQFLFYGPADKNISSVLAVGLGKEEDFNLDILRESVASAVKKCRESGLKTILLPVETLERLPGGRDRLIEESVYAALLGLYRFTEFKTDLADIHPDPEWLAFGASASEQPDSAQRAASLGETAAFAVKLARDLDNMPGNFLFPEALASRAAALGEELGFSCKILDEAALKEAGMNCLLAVGSGSAHPPRLIILERAAEENREEKPIILVGKGVTFDSGGICLKPAANMEQMKCDMSGAAAVLAAIAALAKERAPVRVVGLLACAENLPDGKAFRPGDIYTAANGKTVEVVNTDAEGRLALCDALAYAEKNWTPNAIIDIATLTGACAIALGTDLAGLFCDDQALADKISACGQAAGEYFWRLPLWKKYNEQLKSETADLRHTGGREGGAITAALFLKRFVSEASLWAHLDIAGVDWKSKSGPLCPEGATGFGCRTLLDFCRGGGA